MFRRLQLRVLMFDPLQNVKASQSNYSQTSVFERFGSRTNRFSNNKFEIFTFQTSNKNSDLDQTERSRANTNAP